MMTARCGHVAATIEGCIIICGGSTKASQLTFTNYTNTVEYFDPMRGVWESLLPMSVPRCHFSAAVVGGKLCVFGGRSCPSRELTCVSAENDTRLSSAEQYNQFTGVWEPLPSMLMRRQWAAS